jgi:hypothetical protein
VHVENEGLVAVISFYLYGLIGLSLLVVVSPLIIVAVPLLVVLGPVGFAWWRSRRKSPRVGAAARWWLATTSIAVLALPVVPALWFMIDNDDGAPAESFWLILVGVGLLPFTFAASAYAMRWRGLSESSAAGAPHKRAR